MKNVNYNLIKTLHNALDDLWRLEKYYVKDAKGAKCHSAACLQRMLDTRKKAVEELKQEIKMRMDAGKFN